MNIVSGPEFSGCNKLLDAVLKADERDGLQKQAKHKDSEDEKRLAVYFQDVFETNDTWKLQEFVWYNMALHFGLLGNEVFTKLKKSDLSFVSDGKFEYVVLKCDFYTKNTAGGLASREFQSVGRIQDKLQVKAMLRLLSILPPSEEVVFLPALVGCRSKEGHWFAHAPLGRNSITS